MIGLYWDYITVYWMVQQENRIIPPIPIGAIVHSRAYVTRSVLTLFVDDIKDHQQREYLKFLQRNHYDWEYNFFKNEEYNK